MLAKKLNNRFLSLLGAVLLAACSGEGNGEGNGEGSGEESSQSTESAANTTQGEDLQSQGPAVTETSLINIGESDIGGTVTSSDGPQAGVWVIAETSDLDTRFARIVVTDDEGRYLIPDLPEADYQLWVRGYGLVDSEKTAAAPGSELNLSATVAPDAAAAAQYYPAGYWYSLLNIPSADEFPGTGATGNGINPSVSHQADFIRLVGNGGCVVCHQLGNQATREIPAMFSGFDTSADAWGRRIQSGQAGSFMTRTLAGMGMERTLTMYGDWTDRIAAGELPPIPERPQGLERNVVISQWDWADPRAYLHDVVSSDRRDPTVNAYGPVYGALEESADYVPVLDPITHRKRQIPLDMMNPEAGPVSGPPVAASPYWGEEAIWDSAANVHNPMLDQDGRVWLTARVRGRDNPEWCQQGSQHPSALAYPLDGSGRHLGMYDPETEEYVHIDTCFSTHHLMFAEDENNTLWTSGGGPVIGWLNTRQYLETGDYQAAQGWTPFILDSNGNGRRDDYVGADEPLDPEKDKQLLPGFGFYAVAPAADGSVWGSVLGYPGGVARLVPGDNPTETALVEYYEPPVNENGDAIEGFSPRGMDIDRNGVAWAAMASGHMASFDRSLCEGPLNGPEATGQHCPEGWTFYTEPLPQFKNLERSGSVESSYYTWVDQFDTLGLGANTPINTGNQSGALLALDDGEFVRMIVPYPLGFYTKWMDGRIDDPEAGWKGRGIWATYSSRAPFHMEGGQDRTSIVYHFQLRPDPLTN